MNINDFGKELKNYRETRGVSHDRIAELCGIDTPRLIRIEKGEANPSFVVLQKIAAALGAEVHLVFVPAGENPPIEEGIFNKTPQENGQLQSALEIRRLRRVIEKSRDALDRALSPLAGQV